MEANSGLMIFLVMLCYLSSSERKAWKVQAWTRLEPWPLPCRCRAPQLQLSSQLKVGHYVGRGYMCFNQWNFICTADGNNFTVNDLRSCVMALEQQRKEAWVPFRPERPESRSWKAWVPLRPFFRYCWSTTHVYSSFVNNIREPLINPRCSARILFIKY